MRKTKSPSGLKSTGVQKVFTILVLVGIIGVVIPKLLSFRVQEVREGETYLVDRAGDGDSLIIATKVGKIEIRILGIDAPEKDQDFGPLAKRVLSQLTENQYVLISNPKKDIFGRIMGYIELDGSAVARTNKADKNTENLNPITTKEFKDLNPTDSDNQDVGLQLIESGLAWEYKSTGQRAIAYKQAQATAKKQQLGLWSKENPTPPWVHRKNK